MNGRFVKIPGDPRLRAMFCELSAAPTMADILAGTRGDAVLPIGYIGELSIGELAMIPVLAGMVRPGDTGALLFVRSDDDELGPESVNLRATEAYEMAKGIREQPEGRLSDDWILGDAVALIGDAEFLAALQPLADAATAATLERERAENAALLAGNLASIAAKK